MAAAKSHMGTPILPHGVGLLVPQGPEIRSSGSCLREGDQSAPETLRAKKLGSEWPSHHMDAQSKSGRLPQGHFCAAQATLKFPICVLSPPFQVTVSQ